MCSSYSRLAEDNAAWSHFCYHTSDRSFHRTDWVHDNCIGRRVTDRLSVQAYCLGSCWLYRPAYDRISVQLTDLGSCWLYRPACDRMGVQRTGWVHAGCIGLHVTEWACSVLTGFVLTVSDCMWRTEWACSVLTRFMLTLSAGVWQNELPTYWLGSC
jgi:hypothetical protein